MELGVLGPFQVLRDGQRLPLGGPRQRAVLVVLALNVNSNLPKDRLIELVWAGEPPQSAQGVLQTYIANLRKVLEPQGGPYQMLMSQTAGYELRLPRDAIDANRFEEGVRAGREALAAGDPGRAEVLLNEALGLWRGPALGEFATEPFALGPARRLEELRLGAIEDQVEARLALGRHQELVPELESLLVEHPLRERLAGQLMLALCRGDRQAEASDVYQRTRARLVEETGMEPGANLQELLKRILRQDPALAWAPSAQATPAGWPARALTAVRTPGKPVADPVLSRALCPVMVGRTAELAQLEDILRAALRGDGQVVIRAGDAGVGKTRLAWELAQRASKAGCAVMTGSCSAAELALPYLPFLEALGNYLAVADVNQLGSRLGPARRELAQLFPRLGDDIRPAEGGDPAQGKLRLFEAVLELLRIAADGDGLLLVVEDLQWADTSTRELLDYLSRRLRNARILMLATCRREELHRKHPLRLTLRGWQRSSLGSVVDLQPLSPDGVADMMRAIFDDERVTDEFRDFMHARTEGNPFVLEEMLKAAMDRQDSLLQPRKGDRGPQALEELAIPATVRDTILERLSRLDEEQIEVVRIAAVLGQSFRYQALVAVWGLSEDTLRAALRECVQQQLMEVGPGQDFRFRHALTQEAIYEDLLAPERAARHGRAASALRRVSEVPAADLARHLVLAGDWGEAVPMLIQAAEEAETRRGYYEAAGFYERALPHVADPLLHARLLCRQGEARYLAGEPASAKPRLEEGIALLEEGAQAEEAARHRLTLASCYWLAGRPDLARAEYESVRASLGEHAPSEALAHACYRLAWLHLNEGEEEKGLGMADLAISTAEAARADAPRIFGYCFRGLALTWLGSADAGLVDLDRSWREALERGLNDAAGVALSNTIMMRTLCFRVSETAPLFEHVKAIPDLVHAGGRLATWVCVRKASAAIALGEMPSARTAALDGLPLAQRDESPMMVGMLKSSLAMIECALGRDDVALSLVQELQLEPARYTVSRFAWPIMRVWLDIGRIDRAAEIAAQALQYLEARSRLGVGDVWLLDKAVEVFLAAQMPEQAERLRLKAEAAPTDMQPLRDRVEGRMAVFRGNLVRAEERLLAAAQFLQERSHRDDEWRTRRVLAQVKARRGDRPGAEAELRTVMEGAQAHGHTFEARAARKQLQSSGSR